MSRKKYLFQVRFEMAIRARLMTKLAIDETRADVETVFNSLPAAIKNSVVHFQPIELPCQSQVPINTDQINQYDHIIDGAKPWISVQLESTYLQEQEE